jgi:hypothetical protein
MPAGSHHAEIVRVPAHVPAASFGVELLLHVACCMCLIIHLIIGYRSDQHQHNELPHEESPLFCSLKMKFASFVIFSAVSVAAASRQLQDTCAPAGQRSQQ